MSKKLNIIVAVDVFGGFAKDKKIPWSISEDMQHFKKITSGGICIMGRNTYEDMLAMYKKRNSSGNPISEILPNRRSIVITSQKNYKAEGAEVASSLREAMDNVPNNCNKPIFIIGGLRLFVEALPLVDIVFLTIIKDNYECDMFFPISYLNKHYQIAFGEETEKAYYTKYSRR
jgi:dihydrofolate reductase